MTVDGDVLGCIDVNYSCLLVFIVKQYIVVGYFICFGNQAVVLSLEIWRRTSWHAAWGKLLWSIK